MLQADGLRPLYLSRANALRQSGVTLIASLSPLPNVVVNVELPRHDRLCFPRLFDVKRSSLNLVAKNTTNNPQTPSDVVN